MKNLDADLFVKREQDLDKEKIEKAFNKVEENILNIIQKEKDEMYPITPNFIHDRDVQFSNVAILVQEISFLINNIYYYYFKLELNNKIRAGLITFENAFQEYDEKEFINDTDWTIFAEKIRTKRKELLLRHTTSMAEERKNEIENFWKNFVYPYFYEEFPLLKYFISRTKWESILN